MEAWRAGERPVAALAQITVQDLFERRQRGHAAAVLDVREAAEWNAGHIEGAHLASYRRLAEQLDTLPFSRQDRVAVICHSGARSSTASSILQRHGYTGVENVIGGMQAWKAAKLPITE
jgi:hydroxyacylglutathione hydrolase